MVGGLNNRTLSLLSILAASICLNSVGVDARTRQKTLLDVTDRLYLLDQEDLSPID